MLTIILDIKGPISLGGKRTRMMMIKVKNEVSILIFLVIV